MTVSKYGGGRSGSAEVGLCGVNVGQPKSSQEANYKTKKPKITKLEMLFYAKKKKKKQQ